MGVSGLRSCDEWMGGHLMVTDSLVNVPALHEARSLRGEGWDRHVAWMCRSGRDSLVSKCDESRSFAMTNATLD